MAILFQCPHCDASIRVADTAAGKRGRCPQCQEALLVPDVPRAPHAQPEATVADPLDVVPAVPPARPDDGQFPFAPAGIPPVVTPPPSVARQLRRRQRMRWGRLLVPLFFAAAFAGAVAWLLWKSEPRMEGVIAGVRLADFGPVSESLGLSEIELPKEQAREILVAMQEKPLPSLVSELMRVEFVSDGSRLTVELHRGRETQFYRVPLMKNPLVRDFVKEHLGALEAPRQQELGDAATAFVRDWQEASQAGLVMNAAQYRDDLALPLLSGPLGYHLVAAAEGRLYPCVYQEGSDVYFLLPRGTSQFRVQGRALQGRRLLFPGRFTVNVAKDEQTGIPQKKGVKDAPPDGEPAETNDDRAPEGVEGAMRRGRSLQLAKALHE